jgi:hypothetical protein
LSKPVANRAICVSFIVCIRVSQLVLGMTSDIHNACICDWALDWVYMGARTWRVLSLFKVETVLEAATLVDKNL